MIVSSAMAKRIEDSSSIPARIACEPVRMRTPWVVSDMGEEYAAQKEKGRAIQKMGPPALGLVVRDWFRAVAAKPPRTVHSDQRSPAM